MNRRRSRVLFWSLLAIAVLLRAIFAVETLEDGPFVEPNSDARFYDQWAQAVTQGDLLLSDDWLRPREGAPAMAGGEVFHLPPLYPYLLALVYLPLGWLGLMDLRVPCVMGLQLGLGIANLVLIFALTRRVFGQVAALWALALGVLSSCLLYWEGKLLITTLAVFLSLLTLQQLLVFVESPSRRRAVALGLLLGASVLARPNLLPFVGLAWLWVLWRGRAWADRWKTLGLLSVGLALPLGLSLARNVAVAGDAVLVSDNGGVNFYFGNHVGASGLNMAPDLRFANIFDQASVARRIAEAEEGRSGLKASEVSSTFYRLGREQISSSPGEWLKVEWRKLRLLLGSFEAGIGWVPEAEASLVPMLSLLPVSFAVVLAFAILGLIEARRRRQLRDLMPLWMFLVVGAGVVMLFFFAARLRTPMTAVLLVFAGLGAESFITSMRQRRVVLPVAVVLASWVASTFIVDRDFRARLLSNVHHTQGERLLAQGRGEPARRQLERAVELDPSSGQAVDGLARVLLSDVESLRCSTPGDLAARVALLRRAAELVEPVLESFPYARMTRGEVLLQPEIGDFQGAEDSFLEAARIFPRLGLSPAFPTIRAARAAWFGGEPKRGLELVEETRRIDEELRDDPDVLLIEGLMRKELGDSASEALIRQALDGAEQALAAGASSAASIILEQVIVEAALETGDPERARRVFDRLEARDPCAAAGPRSSSLRVRLLAAEGRVAEADSARKELEARFPKQPR